MIRDVIEINKNYSTTRLCLKLQDKEFNGRKINLTEAKIENSKIKKQNSECFNTFLFLPPNQLRKYEGGLRTKGYLKFSYYYNTEKNEWWACNFRGERLFKTSLPVSIVQDSLEKFPQKEGNIYIPLISIITIVYNGKDFIEDTIKSVLNQNYPNVEYIIIDGGSKDGTIDIIQRYENYIDYWISEKDKGISDAFNKGLVTSFGNYIQILNTGDTFLNNEILLSIVGNFLNKDIIAYQALTDTGNKFPKYTKSKIEKGICDINKKVQNAMCAHQATFISKKAYCKVGFYKDYKIRMDFDMFMRLQEHYDIYCYNEPIIYYLTDGISSKLSNRLKYKLEEYKIIVQDKCPVHYTFKFKFFLNLPIFILKKLLSTIYYNYFRKKRRRIEHFQTW